MLVPGARPAFFGPDRSCTGSTVGPKILVVDDYAQNRLIYGDWLRGIKDVEVVEAADAQRALRLARDHDFAMFLVDINMPDMDGFELASLLRQETRSADTPIVFLTSEATARTYLMRGYRMGAVDFMVSAPVHGEILVQKARVFIQMFRKRQELEGIVDDVRRENQDLHVRLEEFVREQETLRQAATHDPLTRLPNRTLLRDRLLAARARSNRYRQRFALAYVDLDGFKKVNDLHGHGAGDSLIVAVSDRMAKAVRATDTVARLGGDEFALVFEGLDSPAGAQHVADKIHALLTLPVALRSEAQQREVEVQVGASIGLALFPDHASEIDDLVVQADMTMYAVKRAGGGARIFQAPPVKAEPHLALVRKHEA
jgi:diguanylate cyclase (GGDEF)-like protein